MFLRSSPLGPFKSMRFYTGSSSLREAAVSYLWGLCAYCNGTWAVCVLFQPPAQWAPLDVEHNHAGESANVGMFTKHVKRGIDSGPDVA